MQELIEALRVMLAGLWEDSTMISTRFIKIPYMKPRVGERPGEFYFRGLKILGIVVILFPIPLLIVSIFANWPTVISSIGLFWGIFTLLFGIAGVPFAFFVESLIETATGGVISAIKKGAMKLSIEKYLSFIRSILTAEMVSTLCFSVFHVHNNPGMLPEVIVAMIVIGLLSSTSRWKKYVSVLATLVVVMGIYSFVMPNSFASTQKWLDGLDEEKPVPDSVSTGTLPQPSSVTVVFQKPVRKDEKSFPTWINKGDSVKFNLFSLDPFRYFYDMSVSDPVQVHFRDTSFTVYPGGSISIGKRPGIFWVVALSDSTKIIPSAWNQ